MTWLPGPHEGPYARVEPAETTWPSSAWSPPADVLRTDETVIVRVELAGVAPADIRVRASDRELLVTGQRRESTATRPRRIDRMEISFGPFARMIPLPEPVQPDAAEARLADGLLEIILPLADPVQPAPAAGLLLAIVVVRHDA